MKRVLAIYREEAEAEPYADALRGAGLEPVMRSASEHWHLDGIAGLLLTGGSDVNPALYGEEPGPDTDAPDDERDAVECALIEAALRTDLPVLAICRGLQILNVYHGGSLVQHLGPVERHRVRSEERGTPAHPVEILPDTLLASIAETGLWHVNSRHHQAVARLGRGLRISARDRDDAMVEAVERPDCRFVLGVQWHPENQWRSDPGQARLFTRFAGSL